MAKDSQDEEMNIEVYNKFMQAYECTEQDKKRKFTDEELKQLCKRVKCRVDMTRWNAVHDYYNFFKKQNRLQDKTQDKIQKLIRKAVNRNKDKSVYTDDDIKPVLEKEKLIRLKNNILLLELWEYDRKNEIVSALNQEMDQSTESIEETCTPPVNLNTCESVEIRSQQNLEIEELNTEESFNSDSPISKLVKKGKAMQNNISRNIFSLNITKNNTEKVQQILETYNSMENTLNAFLETQSQDLEQTIPTENNKEKSVLPEIEVNNIPSSTSLEPTEDELEGDLRRILGETEQVGNLSVFKKYLEIQTESFSLTGEGCSQVSSTKDISNTNSMPLCTQEIGYSEFDNEIESTATSTQAQSEVESQPIVLPFLRP